MDCVPDTPCLGAVTRYFPLGLVGLGVKTIRSAGSVGFEKDKILLAVLMDGGAEAVWSDASAVWMGCKGGIVVLLGIEASGST